MKRILYILMTVIMVGPFTSYAQTNELQVSGTVSDEYGGTLPGVTVKVKGTTAGVSTGVDGKYSLRVPTTGTLVFSFLGYNTREVPVNNQQTLNIKLTTNTTDLSEVTVVGYTTQTNEKTTAAVSKLDTKQLVNTADASPLAAIQGKIAGVSLPLSNGQPGSAPSNIIIRGSSQVNAYGSGTGNANGNNYGNSDAANPLIIIDGVFRDLKDINPDDVESMQVMKDAASTAAYGARGANGVIVIRTKTGKFSSGKANLSFNYRMNLETMARDLQYLDAEDYLRLARTTVQNSHEHTTAQKNNLLNSGGFSAGTKNFTQKGQYGNDVNLTALYDNIVAIEGQAYVDNLLARGWKVMDDPISPGRRLLYADNQYQDLLWNTGYSNNYNVGLDGGSETANYNVSLNYVDQEGTFVGTNYKRYGGLANFGFKASNNIGLKAMVNYQNVLPNFVEAYNNEIVRGTRLTPLIRIYKDDGTPTTGEVIQSVRNRFHTLAYDDTRVTNERLISRLEGDWTAAKGLHFRPSVSYVVEDNRTLFSRKAFPDPIQFPTSRQKNESARVYRQLMVDQILQYDFKTQDKHSFTTLGGFNFTRETSNSITIGSQRATNDYITTIDEPVITTVNGITVSNVTDFGTGLSENKSASFFGQLNYDFDSRYLATAVVRNDGFSNFSPENKYALFSAFSAGWNIHRENFWKSKAVSMLKLRGSWGQAGSTSGIRITDTYGNYTANLYAQNPGILRDNLANPNLKWETTETTDIAVDAGFLNNRITLTLDYYNRLTKDRLDVKPLPGEAPFSSIVFNNGVLQNQGLEVELGGTVLSWSDFTWKTNFTFAYNNQKIQKLPGNGRLKNRQGGGVVFDPATGKEIEVGGLAEGERPFAIYAFKVEKVFETDAEAAAWKKVDQLASAPGIMTGKRGGDFKWADLNNDNIIDNRDMVFIGYRTPNKTGGMQNTLSYKRLTLRLNMDFATGHVISDGALARSLGQARAGNEGAPAEAMGNDIWKVQGDVGKKYARFSVGDAELGQKNYVRRGTNGVGISNMYASDVSVMIEKGDFLAFRQAYLSYDLPLKLTEPIKATGMTVFGSVSNLGYLTRYKGQNPESYTGFDPGGYPRPRQFTFGASLRF